MRAIACVLCILTLGVLQETSSSATQVLYVEPGAPVNVQVGPKEAIYCRLENRNRAVFYDGFGPCVLRIEWANFLHIGFWRMYVALPEKITTEMYLLEIKLGQEPRPQVRMSAALSNDNTTLTVSCSVETPSAPRLCKFRSPFGQILVPQEGVDDGRYSFYGAGVSNESGKYTMDCGLSISAPHEIDLGIWRCGIDTEEDSYFGFLLVNFPSHPNQEFIQTEPILTSNSQSDEILVGHSVAMSCTIPSSIRYCYFRSQNGTVISLSPGESTDTYEYVGNGLDAGECGLRLKAVSVNDEGIWSCHVGLADGATPEQNATIILLVTELMVASLTHQGDRSVVVRGLVRDVYMHLEYCRFVRSDGFGFTNDYLPEGYEFTGSLWFGSCELRIPRPTTADLRRWTVAARMTGRRTEVVARTQDISNSYWHPLYVSLRITVLVLCIGLVLIAFVLLLGPKKNRQWTYARAAAARDSIRRSLRKAPPLEADKTVTSPQAA
ncbi:hypothetical protein EVAR_806_1 [Eumeta japonica]|uniref:Ig-like domain-containing protein n=1 Tax=Eumeta variegata TaxID=151549 RepID=A0A4C1SC82_EUMVA|nr:hypothetical protein EVAR_806_1 [Eumeta japonica]